jgi:phosphatidylglycerophosphate synthase
MDEEPAEAGTVTIVATAATMPGAAMRVAGLTVVERAIKQWAHARRQHDGRVAVASDGAVALPRPLPPGVVVQEPATLVAEGALRGRVVPGNRVDPAVRPGGGASALTVTDEPSRRRAEDAVFAELVRGDLGLVARWINKPLSFRLTRHLFCRLPVTPNQITVGASVVGLLGAALIATGHRLAVVAGFALAQIQSVLDGCDGELARVRFQQSVLGEWLDSIADDTLNVAFLVAVGLALGHPERGGVGATVAGPVLGVVAALMLLTYNAVAYRELLRQGHGGGAVLKVRWWFAGGGDATALVASGRRRPVGILYAIGRRDFFVLAWLVLALCDLLVVVLAYGLVVSVTSFVVAMGQLASTVRARRK